jgi:hypothetical protein
MAEVLVKIMAEIISILSIATREMQRSRASELSSHQIFYYPLSAHIQSETYILKLFGNTDIENALKRLDSLTREEVQIAIAQVLKVMSELRDGTHPPRSGNNSTPNIRTLRCRGSQRDRTTDREHRKRNKGRGG